MANRCGDDLAEMSAIQAGMLPIPLEIVLRDAYSPISPSTELQGS